MRKRLQLVLTDEAMSALEALLKEANEGFKCGSISISDIVNEVLLTAKIDVRVMQAKHTNIRRSLRDMANQKDIDIDLAIKNLMELKAVGQKRITKQQISMKGLEQ